MLWIQSGDLKEGKAREVQEWVLKNEDLIRKHAPPGWTLRGTYFYVLGLRPVLHGGHVGVHELRRLRLLA